MDSQASSLWTKVDEIKSLSSQLKELTSIPKSFQSESSMRVQHLTWSLEDCLKKDTNVLHHLDKDLRKVFSSLAEEGTKRASFFLDRVLNKAGYEKIGSKEVEDDEDEDEDEDHEIEKETEDEENNGKIEGEVKGLRLSKVVLDQLESENIKVQELKSRLEVAWGESRTIETELGALQMQKAENLKEI